MNETTDDRTNDRTGDATGDAMTGPTRAQRLGLSRAVAARALGRADPLRASLGVVTADVLGLTHALGAEVQAALSGPAGGGREQLARDAGDLLRLTRELGRLARLERQVAGGEGEGPPR